jgi:hypothetical protein
METLEHKGKQFDIKWSKNSSHTADIHHLYMPYSIRWAVKGRKVKKAGHASWTGTEVNFVRGVFWESDNMDDKHTDRGVNY